MKFTSNLSREDKKMINSISSAFFKCTLFSRRRTDKTDGNRFFMADHAGIESLL